MTNDILKLDYDRRFRVYCCIKIACIYFFYYTNIHNTLKKSEGFEKFIGDERDTKKMHRNIPYMK